LIHLDTNFLIRALLPGSAEDHHLRAWVRARTSVAISTVSWTEFLCGPVESQDVEAAAHVLLEPVPLVAADSALAARLFELGGRRRGSLVDCMIAAVAINADAELATTNVADFKRFQSAGLKIVPAAATPAT
jgi:predicted nucleic acid-binding protein